MEKDENSKMKIIVYILVVIFSCVFIFVGNKICRTDLSNEETGEYYKARINSIDKLGTNIKFMFVPNPIG